MKYLIILLFFTCTGFLPDSKANSVDQIEQGKFKYRSADKLSEAEINTHKKYMQRAIELAHAATGSPFGAVIVDRQTGKILCEGSNKGDQNPALHGEMVAILNCKKEQLKQPNLTIYSTAEPCSMCFGAISWAGIDQIVYATSLSKMQSFGIRSIHIDSIEHAKASVDFPIGKGEIIGDILAKETDSMYQEWASTLKASDWSE